MQLLSVAPSVLATEGTRTLGVESSAPVVDALTPSTIGLDYLFAAGQYGAQEGFLESMLAAQFEQQGLLPPGTAPGLGSDTRAVEVSTNRPLPPGLRFQDAHASCDLDADGTDDVVMNEMALASPPYDSSGFTRLKGVSGENGSVLWKRDALYYSHLILPSGVAYVRYGEALPKGPRNMAEAADLNEDGVCDYVTVGFSVTNTISVPFTRVYTREFEVYVYGISGTDGSDIWKITHKGRMTQVQDNLRAVTVFRVEGFPTGFLAFDSPSGPKFVLKTTDLTYEQVYDVLEITDDPGIDHAIFNTPFRYANATAGDHVRLYDATDATLQWHRLISGAADPDHTRIGWLSGATNLAGDDEYEIVLDHLTITNPRSSESHDPITGKPVARYSKGMRMMALEGELAGTGATLWDTVVFDPLVVRANPPVEEPFEQLVWTHAFIMADLDGDGIADPMALWLGTEENMGATTNGVFSTHVVPLSGATGEILWQVRQQGWGNVENLMVGPDSKPLVGMGFLDVPTLPPRGGRFPPKFVRLIAVDATDGATMWSYEKRFAQNSYTIYSMALGQFQTSLAPFDWDGDGIKDMITPSQYSKPEGTNQVLLAMSNHSYEVLSGADGSVIRTIKSWGPDGRVVACAGAEAFVTTVSGHARRMDLTRFDIATGDQVFRRPVYNDPAPRAATSSIDITAFGTRCDDDSRGRTIYSFNMQQFSFDRRNEVVAVQAIVEPSGTTLWQSPELRGNPPTKLIFEPYSNDAGAATLVDTIITLSVAGFLGVGLGLASVVVWKRRRLGGGSMGGTLGVTIVLLFIGMTLAPLATPAATLTDATTAVTTAGGIAVSDLLDVDLGVEPLVTRPAASTPAALPPTPADPTRAVADSTPSIDEARPDRIRGMDGEGVLGTGPITDLAYGLAALGAKRTPQAHLDLIETYFTDLGFNTAASGGDTKNRFEENLTLSYTYAIGDIDGDGTDDLALDEYCIDYDACGRARSDITDLAYDWTVRGRTSTSPHHLWAISGVDGTAIWNVSLDVPRPIVSTGTSFVLGTLPTANGVGILVYKYILNGNIDYEIEHEYYLVDANTGEKMWSFTEIGSYTTDLLGEDVGETVVINPIMEARISDGLDIVAKNTVPALFLQGVGFQTDAVDSLMALPGINHPVTVTDAYRAKEWAAKVDIDTGTVEWRKDTFTPDPRLSIAPAILDIPSFRFNYGLPATVEALYWAGDRCCFDTTGDGVPDILYKVYEWNPFRATNVEGPYDLDARLVIIDGATGDVAIDMYLQQDIGFSYETYYQTLGDVNGDGVGDFAIHEVFYDFQYWHIVTVRNGPDAAELWRIESPRDLRIFVIGDATGDGGNDFVYVDWYYWEIGNYPFIMNEDLATVQRLPLTLYNGATGEQVWRVHTISAPSDTLVELGMLRLNGLPDFDQDGVGDFTIDDPLYLGDQTVIHRQHVLSGRTASTLYTIESVGAFGIPTRVPDITGDGIEDLAIVSGDLNDLWISTYDGQDGEAQWSRRLLALPSSNSASAVPRVRFLGIGVEEREAKDLLVNFHLYVTSASRIVYASGDGPYERFTIYRTITPQILRFEGNDGRLEWAFPRVEEPALLAVVGGQSPGTQTYHALKISLAEAPVREVQSAAISALAPMGTFALGYLSVLGVVLLGSRIKRNPREEVPTLD